MNSEIIFALIGGMLPLAVAAAGRMRSPSLGKALFLISNLPGVALTGCAELYDVPSGWIIAIPGLIGGALGYGLGGLMRQEAQGQPDN